LLGGIFKGGAAPAKRSMVDELMQKEIEAKASKNAKQGKSERLDHWLHSGIVVKVMSKELKEHGYYKQKVCIYPHTGCSHQIRLSHFALFTSTTYWEIVLCILI
jgi:23S rRNA-/tRNA-specific pseudouridylate synthase